MNRRPAKENKSKKCRAPIIIFIVFWFIAIILWQTKGNIFYLFNFGYIGTAVGVGVGLYVLFPREKKPSDGRFAQLLVGIYMLGFLGLLKKENMQLEGFFFYLLGGFFAGSVIHYMVAKVAGPGFSGRLRCGRGTLSSGRGGAKEPIKGRPLNRLHSNSYRFGGHR